MLEEDGDDGSLAVGFCAGLLVLVVFVTGVLEAPVVFLSVFAGAGGVVLIRIFAGVAESKLRYKVAALFFIGKVAGLILIWLPSLSKFLT